MNAAAAGGAIPRLVVLLVDDEAPLLEVLRLGLKEEFEIEVASSAEDGELMMATRKYDVLVCDHLMPGEEGLRFLIRASRLFPHTRRILITGYMNPELISRSVALAGLAVCLLKPLKIETLAAAIREAAKSPVAPPIPAG